MAEISPSKPILKKFKIASSKTDRVGLHFNLSSIMIKINKPFKSVTIKLLSFEQCFILYIMLKY